ncbi:hypothetical protein I204_08406 [Kwoniella mangroviensis CBS 8886]|uniref:uncharacterized protein n=1 Tax=Kwoniella mangroviensis CBS 8507 TaxID=1296122 RepID=UPI00080D25AC|nr:uncharacterized protein I203_01437 [Kwoniella mangroviensis CBS 8507]OCF69573.1 hypothetical protein I203_01437 [Kwoniella mangroviensis CBS 8507]OCF70971.1 hypothetical protein I204_08406 [Kwoniella mangroviensis CBS 8886]
MPDNDSRNQPSTNPQSSNGSASSSQTTTPGSGIFSSLINSLVKVADPKNGIPGDPDGTMIAEYYSRGHENDRSTK